ncbi:NAD(P)H-dependent oxidoreductase [Actinobacillus equuli]|uniref:NAD(P)H-dependent oxidoreductase n=1 Tax=Actinobacillus equuli TaxID=718 RepID=UPI002441A3F7|nr:NAD(P)H-dependent oxidoreductase [Actinobacillus equuli]WGE52789.1 NAD(P)H-dependent oxidoreductase [Actinobacillus equuli subsp. haemolyticus]WGE73232.1 NAD(P)H-dependent oxidoreductase [Actinobacillus equuli subsp. haemolyticus]
MNHLIIYAHPNPQSFNHAILSQVVQASQDHQVIVRDLYQLNFNPNLAWQEFQSSLTSQYPTEIQIEHRYWQQADVITLIYPLWWMGFPAILKGYLDRVLSYGFAYQNGEIESVGLLKGKKMQQFVTLGNPNEKYQQKGFLQAFEHTMGNGLFNFCGIEQVKMHYFGCVGLKDTDYAAILQQVTDKSREILS